MAAGDDVRIIAAVSNCAAFFTRERDVRGDLLLLPGVDQRADLGRRIERMSALQAGCNRGYLFSERRRDAALGDDTRTCVAGLAGIVEDAPGDGAGRSDSAPLGRAALF